MNLVDTHCHLNFPPLVGALGDVLARSRAAGVSRIIVPAYDLASWPVVERFGETTGLYPALGLHPWAAAEVLDPAELEQRLDACHAVAVGEVGLDFKIDTASRNRQLGVLNVQLEIAARRDLPVLLHCRGAFEEMLDALRRFAPALRGVIHAFSRGPELAGRFTELGLHIAFGGAITRTRAKRARRAAKSVDLEKILLETDAPSIGLDGVEPDDVEPRHVKEVALALSEIRDIPLSEVAKRTTDNARRLFNIA